MTDLEAALSRLRDHPGVENVILLGRDGLIIHQLEQTEDEGEAVAASVPALTFACESLGEASRQGGFRTAVVEFERGVMIVLSIAPDLLLALVVRPGVGFAPLLAELRTGRHRLSELL